MMSTATRSSFIDVARRHRPVTVLLAVTLVVLMLGAGGLGIVSLIQQADGARTRARDWEVTARAWKVQTERLQRQLAESQTLVSATRDQAAQLQVTVDGLSAQLAHGLASQPASGWFLQWNTCGGPCTIGTADTRWGRAVPVPDTFDMDVSFTATVPVRLDFYDWRDWVSGHGNGLPAASYGPSLGMQHVRFTLAEGCGGYIASWSSDQPGVLFPQVWVRYNPSPHVTGFCRTP